MKKIILKYLNGEITNLEQEHLLNWLKNPKNIKKFQALVKENYQLDLIYNDIDDEIALREVKTLIQNKEKPVRKIYLPYYAAASILLLISLTFLFNKNTNENETVKQVLHKNNITIGSDKAILTLEDGKEIALDKQQNYATNNFKSNGEQIIYNPPSKPIPNIVYNYLTVPRGAQFQIKLADNTKVWLNSESQIKYPVHFVKGQDRQVELVYGEAYFDVSSSTKNGGDQFKVLTHGQEVKVLGTEFNIKAYKEETDIYTTLVEGRIRVNNTQSYAILKPNQQSVNSTTSNTLNVVDVDIYNEISWKNGVFSFKRTSLKEIMKVLSRWYDFKVVFENNTLKEQKFIGVLNKNQSIDDILTTLKSASIIKDYQIKNKTIILK
ncbi:FecR family protein [Polaribacter batillariae]|uniref:FecR family protein n=1 Tax=Polaribacter batillariae TaxID=2808900 RepID=A0ABX7SRZ2_9FLAO|nr:FecR family protein [Polaribacter batillariae]QTD36911.1 FecR family protein [Polaribacter batillariae]